MPVASHILILARYPVPGQAKTRLIPALGPDDAARLHRRMTEQAVAAARAAGTVGNTAVTVCFTGGPRRAFRAWLGTDLLFQKQPAGDLGARLHRAFAAAFRNGATRALAVGCDASDLTAELLRQALRALDEHDIVLGPAADGGYYLLGMTRLHPGLFRGMDWGTERVCAQTRDAIIRMGIDVTELPPLSDVDRPQDLDPLRSDERFADVFTGRPVVSVIIPTLNEATVLPKTLERVRRADGIEMIVADGGSQDATRELAHQAGAAVLEVPARLRCAEETVVRSLAGAGEHIAVGRAAQQNAGAAAARGRYILFLHADTLLPDGYADMIRGALDCPATVAGAFRFAADVSRAGMRLVEWGANIRSAIFQWPYGDQGLFMERRVFAELGGFAQLPIMEDFDLVRRLRQRGRIATLREAAVTSGRRWRKLGAFRTTLRNQVMITGFFAGVPPERLARLYRRNGRLLE